LFIAWLVNVLKLFKTRLIVFFFFLCLVLQNARDIETCSIEAPTTAASRLFMDPFSRLFATAASVQKKTHRCDDLDRPTRNQARNKSSTLYDGDCEALRLPL
jgi:hypothetical protein